MAVTIIHKHDLKLSFGGFVKKALPFAIVQLVIAVAYMPLGVASFWLMPASNAGVPLAG